MRRRAITVAASVALAALFVVPAANAQLPVAPPVPIPGAPAPSVPGPVQDGISQVGSTLLPYLLEAAGTAQPATNAAGFALRPACVQAATLTLALALAGLPANAGIVTQPFTAFCAGALRWGPVDPTLMQVDGTVGPQAQDAAEPVLVAANPVVRTLRPNMGVPCLVLVIAGPSALPPPANRFNATREACWR